MESRPGSAPRITPGPYFALTFELLVPVNASTCYGRLAGAFSKYVKGRVKTVNHRFAFMSAIPTPLCDRPVIFNVFPRWQEVVPGFE